MILKRELFSGYNAIRGNRCDYLQKEKFCPCRQKEMNLPTPRKKGIMKPKFLAWKWLRKIATFIFFLKVLLRK